MFSVMCPGAPFVQTAPGPPEHENYVSTFRGPDAPECTTCPQIAPDAKTHVRRNFSRRAFRGIRTGPTRA
jgi:hypothetical protein